MLEQLINLKIAIRQKKEKHIVKQKFLEYVNEYDNAERNIGDKIRHREIFYTYCQYMGMVEKRK